MKQTYFLLQVSDLIWNICRAVQLTTLINKNINSWNNGNLQQLGASYNIRGTCEPSYNINTFSIVACHWKYTHRHEIDCKQNIHKTRNSSSRYQPLNIYCKELMAAIYTLMTPWQFEWLHRLDHGMSTVVIRSKWWTVNSNNWSTRYPAIRSAQKNQLKPV